MMVAVRHWSMTVYKILLAVGVFFAVLIVAGYALSAWSWRRPTLGLVDGKLRPCGSADNCVTSLHPDFRMQPLRFDGPAEDAWRRLRSVISQCPRVEIIEDDGQYLRVEFTTQLFRFVDDVEFHIDPQAKCIHFRSASRVGRSDLGVNRKRMQKIAEAFDRAR